MLDNSGKHESAAARKSNVNVIWVEFQKIRAIQHETGLDFKSAELLRRYRSAGGSKPLTGDQRLFCQKLEEKLADEKAEQALGRLDARPADIDWDALEAQRERQNGSAPSTNGRGNGSTQPFIDRGSRYSERAQATPPRQFKLTPFENIRFDPAPPYVVKGIVPRNGLVTVWGPPKCGKSFWTFDLAMHVALGWAYRDCKVEQGNVVYCAAEGGPGFANRVEAWRQRHLAQDQDPIPFYLLAMPLDLIGEHAALIAAIRAQAKGAPKLVVIDTLNRTLVGSENRPEDMSRFIRAADAVRVAFGCAVIVIHHCGVDGTRPRGHTSLAGADDAQIAVSRDKSGLIKIEVEHLKDGIPSKPLACRLEGVEIGACADGDAATSCVVVPADLSAASTKPRGASVSANQTRFLDILNDAVLDAPPQHKTTVNIPGGRTAVSREFLKTCCISSGWFDEGDSDNARRAKVSNMINALSGKRLIGASKIFVWPVS